MTTIDEMGPLLITVPELGTVADEDEAARACALASGMVLDYLGRATVVEETYTHTLPVSADVRVRDEGVEPSGTVGVIVPLVTPVTEVTTVTVAGVDLVEDVEWSWDASRGEIVIDDPAAWEATVVYDAGWEEAPAGLRAVARRLALSLIANPAGLRSEQAGDYSVSFNGADFSPLERRILDRYRPKAGTIKAR